MRILMIEDDDLVADALARGLGAAGFGVDRAGTVAAARVALESGTFDLILLDLGLPDGDGLQFLPSLRRAGHATPVFVLTARDALADRVEALDQGADDYLVKPFAIPEVVARARALILSLIHI